MAEFNDLPLELVPLILSHILKASQLVHICLVSKAFYAEAVPKLYEYAVVYAWHRNAKVKVMRLMRTLSECPYLAKYVNRLELRDFPKALPSGGYDEFISTCERAIKNCKNLHSCTWTRDGSLVPRIFEGLLNLPALHSLEINGNDQHFSPDILAQFKSLQKITLIMPSSGVIEQLSPWFRSAGQHLLDLTVICKASPLLSDTVLMRLAPKLTKLQHLHLTGCTKVTHDGILAVLPSSVDGVKSLGLEGLATSFDMACFSHRCLELRALRNLQRITLTLPPPTMLEQWLDSVAFMLNDVPLRGFRLYTAGGDERYTAEIPMKFIQHFGDTHGSTLEEFAALRVRVTLEALGAICSSCHHLSQLYVAIQRRDLSSTTPILSSAPKLRSVHFTFVRGPRPQIQSGAIANKTQGNPPPHAAIQSTIPTSASQTMMPTQQEILDVVRCAGGNLQQFGVQSRVWQVERIPVRDAESNILMEVRLGPYERQDVPEAFLVVKA